MKEVENFKAVIRTISSISTPVECSTVDNHILSLFMDMIASVEMAKMSVLLSFHKFQGDTDPVELIAEYRQ